MMPIDGPEWPADLPDHWMFAILGDPFGAYFSIIKRA